MSEQITRVQYGRSRRKIRPHGLGPIALAVFLTSAMGLASAQSPPPDIPMRVIYYPGADFTSLTCKPGPAAPPNAEVDRMIRVFISDVQMGADHPRYEVPYYSPNSLPRLPRREFAQLVPLQELLFRGANIACANMIERHKRNPRSKIATIYRYHLVGSDASMWMMFSVQDGLIDEFHQELGPE